MNNNMQVNSIKDLIPYIKLFNRFEKFVTPQIKDRHIENTKAKLEPVCIKYNNQDYIISSPDLVKRHPKVQLKKRATLTIIENDIDYFTK